jgi:hypothetical protein
MRTLTVFRPPPKRRPARRFSAALFPAAAAGAYTLAADPGAYVVTGTAATLTVGHRLAADAGAYVLSGTAATLKVGYRLTADAGAYVLSGTAATFARTYRLTADSGAFVWTGTAATLTVGSGLPAVVPVGDTRVHPITKRHTWPASVSRSVAPIQARWTWSAADQQVRPITQRQVTHV